MEYGQTALNKQYALSCLRSNSKAVRALEVRKTAVAYGFVRFSLTRILAHCKPAVYFIRWAGTSHT